MMEVKRLPLTARVRVVHHRQRGRHGNVTPAAASAAAAAALVDLTGHRLRLLSIDDCVFLRANAINNGLLIPLHSTSSS